MRINILDPGLIFSGGHHLEYDLGLARELIARGHQTCVYSHVRVSQPTLDAVSAIARIEPIFRASPYADARKIDPVSGELRVFLDGALMLTEDLGRVDAADAWIWPSLFAPQLHACALLKTRAQVSGCIHMEPTFMATHGRMWWRYAFNRARTADLRLNLGVTIAELEREYSVLEGEGRISLWPVAHEGLPISQAKARLNRIGFFGHQRAEKGVGVLEPVISRLLREGFEVVLQDSSDRSHVVEIPGLLTLGYVPSLAAEIARCDLIVLPYDPVAYRLKGSGVAWEAIASGIPLTGPAGTPIGSLAMSTGAGTLFVALTPDEVCRAVLEARDNYRRIADAAFETSRTWRAKNGFGNFVSAMLGNPGVSAAP
jgi:hypothetical protein